MKQIICLMMFAFVFTPLFISAQERSLTWIINGDANHPHPANSKIETLTDDLIKNGWSLRTVKQNAVMDDGLAGSKLIIIDLNASIVDIPDAFYCNLLVPAVQEGAVVLFNGYGQLPSLEEYFQDESFKVNFSEDLDSLRKTASITMSSFSYKPHNMKSVFANTTPPGVYIPAVPEKWEVLATQKMKNGAKQPYLLARPYGKGMVAVIVAPIGYARQPEAVVFLLDNLLEYNNKIKR